MSWTVQTEGICAQPAAWQSRVRELVETFDAFTPGNDPHGEHDFGRIEHEGVNAFWKIDYYDRALQYEGHMDPDVWNKIGGIPKEIENAS